MGDSGYKLAFVNEVAYTVKVLETKQIFLLIIKINIKTLKLTLTRAKAQ